MLKGDKLRELILFIYLNDKYGRSSEFRISELKNFFSYSTGGIYGALDSSGFFIRNGSTIKLSEEGVEYAKKELIIPFKNFYSIAYLLVYLGLLLLLHWYLYIYMDFYLFFDWQVGFGLIIGGLLLRFALPRLTYIILILKKKFSS